jgi:hypothetical protein
MYFKNGSATAGFESAAHFNLNVSTHSAVSYKVEPLHPEVSALHFLFFNCFSFSVALSAV